MAARKGSALRCKPGDMAIIVKGPNTGKLVAVERLHTDPNERISGERWHNKPNEFHHGWVVQSLSGLLGAVFMDDTTSPRQYQYAVIADCLLRPIRKRRGADETMHWTKRLATHGASDDGGLKGCVGPSEKSTSGA